MGRKVFTSLKHVKLLELAYTFCSGCPDGSVTAAFSPANTTNTTMTLIFDSFSASWWSTEEASHENCQLNVEFFIPYGLTFFVTSIDHRGFAYLDQGCIGDVTTTYYFSGESNQVSNQIMKHHLT